MFDSTKSLFKLKKKTIGINDWNCSDISAFLESNVDNLQFSKEKCEAMNLTVEHLFEGPFFSASMNNILHDMGVEKGKYIYSLFTSLSFFTALSLFLVNFN